MSNRLINGNRSGTRRYNQNDISPPFWKFIEFIAPEKSTLSKQIVILEDEEMFSFQLSMILNNLPSQKKHTVLRFAGKQEFMDSCKKNGVPDILFLDYFLEDGNGHEVLEYLKNQNKSCETIVLSSQIDIDTALTLNLEGVSEFILKDEHWTESIRECASKHKL